MGLGGWGVVTIDTFICVPRRRRQVFDGVNVLEGVGEDLKGVYLTHARVTPNTTLS